ncbi:aminotransferase class I/II-fold pyridoxal phosphate-dependent enzyme [Paraburkholderia sp. MMS20-SJTR3]|uniref:Aminotransferase class I/II-fold pyridoxal phosphate-dependent enzyme n=1 Tax=Paraburkholderia sejongensis TaxID=2886946 RepID=A0ABS8K5A9_9BURK|nr:aminotransferase class I/II-fold pyridoxal phosphate-dependent enzyme [Paraburkholderia sp. MMS20-SJTR3]MCC8397332.1 aminotransferase class I/II-fold pyridoxal phosphate-dependent enzyme [Paraburkholderia sp. MMS20-SJTR3]
MELLPDHPRLVVTRTPSKAFKFAGGRVGVLRLCACDHRSPEARSVAVSPVHFHAGSVAREEMLSQVEAIKAERDATVSWLRSQGLAVANSDANFVMFGKFADRHCVWNGLLRHGVLIREAGPPEYLRVSIGTAAEMGEFRTALLTVMASV